MNRNLEIMNVMKGTKSLGQKEWRMNYKSVGYNECVERSLGDLVCTTLATEVFMIQSTPGSLLQQWP